MRHTCICRKAILSDELVFLTVALLLLAGCTVGGVDVEQEQASGLAGELLDGHTFGQTFTPQYDGLYRIDLYTATYARENTHPVIFRIHPTPSQGEGQGGGLPSPACGGGDGEGADLVRLELPATEISNSGPTVITFPPLAGTAGQTLAFSVESPGSVPGDAITIYRHEQDVYPGGEMFVDGQPSGGDIAFIAYTQETFTFADIWNDFYSRASQDKPFFGFYCSLLALLLLALVATLVWPRRRRGTKETGNEERAAIKDPAVSPASSPQDSE
jgi:hypothetical protein